MGIAVTTDTKRRLTEKMLEKITPPRSGRLELGDDLCPGLVLRISDSGTRSFSVIYRVAGEGGVSASGAPLTGTQHRITLGKWPVLSLAEAREEARRILRTASEGVDPRAERIAAICDRRANTLSAVLDRHIKQDAARTISSWKNVERVLRLHVVPHLGDRPMADIRRAEIHQIIDDLVANGRVGTAREVRKQMSRLFGWAEDREIIPHNPMHGLRRNDLARNTEAGRALNEIEIRAIWKAADEMRYPFGTLYQILMLTGQRRAEWAFATRSEINAAERLLELGKARFKSRREHIVPMSDAAWAIFERMPVWTGGNDYYLFSSQAGRVPVAGFSQGKRKLDELAQQHLRNELGDRSAELKLYRIHDFRVTCETGLAQLGFNREVRDAVLGHSRPGLQQTYNKHDYLAEKREALQSYGAAIIRTIA